MKILLTYASIDDRHREENDWNYESPTAHYPLGLAYLHSYLESLDRGYELETKYLNHTSLAGFLEIIEKEIKTFKPDVIGVSLITHSRIAGFRMIELVQEKYPHIHIVLGGMHVSVTYKDLTQQYPGVVCAIGEGEITLGELVEKWDNDLPINDVRGISYYDYEEKKVVVTPERPLINDLDTLPFPKHDLFIWEGRTTAGLLTSRGCPYKCNFCVLDAASRRKVRCRSAKNIVDEIEYVMNNHPTIDTMWLHDDAFMIIKDRTIEFCEEIIRRGIKIKLICSARFRPISRQVVMLMKEAGFVHVLFGLESGAESVMKLMKKGLTQKIVRHGLKLFSETGIKATVFLIVGLPGETAETIEESIDFVQELQDIQYLYYDDIGVAQVYPGTELYTLMKEAKVPIEGYGPIDDGYWLTDGHVPQYTRDHTSEQLLEWKEKTRSAISLDQILRSSESFLKQRKLMNSIIDYSWRHHAYPKPESAIIEVIMELLDKRPLVVYGMLRSLFINEFPTEIISEVRMLLEREVIKLIFEWPPLDDVKMQRRFIAMYENQIKEDKKTIARWRATQKREQSGLDIKNHDYTKEVVTKEGTMVVPFEDDGLDEERKRRTSSRSLKIIQ